MRKIVVILGLVFLVLLPQRMAHAAEVLDPVCQTNPQATLCQESSKTQTPGDNSIYGPDSVLTRAVSIISIVLGVAAVIVMTIAGLRYTLASGDPANVNKAKNTIIYAAVGLAVAIGARAIISLVLNKI